MSIIGQHNVIGKYTSAQERGKVFIMKSKMSSYELGVWLLRIALVSFKAIILSIHSKKVYEKLTPITIIFKALDSGLTRPRTLALKHKILILKYNRIIS